jgi:hypothetical protein
MAKSSAKSAKRVETKKTTTPKKEGVSPQRAFVRHMSLPVDKLKKRVSSFLVRRPHRSFRRTRRRDYERSLELPGYWSFTNQVRSLLWERKKTFLWVAIIYGVMSALLVGIASQDSYTALGDTLRDTSGNIFEGNWGEIGKAGLLFASTITGNAGATPTEAQQIYAGIIALLIWLTTVWLLRAFKAGQAPRIRDGLYNAGAPIVPTTAIALVLILQLVPAALAVIAFSAALSTGFLQGGVESMLFSVVAALLMILSIYWVTSTIIALVVVTLPGMYPMQALKTAGDLVIGRRLRILLRWVWLIAVVIVTWVLVMIPIIIFDSWLKSILPIIQWLPLVPVSLLVMSSLSVVFVASYVYLLYRRIVEDDAAPA